jgi:hypothetical protein
MYPPVMSEITDPLLEGWLGSAYLDLNCGASCWLARRLSGLLWAYSSGQSTVLQALVAIDSQTEPAISYHSTPECMISYCPNSA